MLHVLAATALHPALACHSIAVSLLLARPGACGAPGIRARDRCGQRLYSDEAISTAKMPCACQPIHDLPAMCAGHIWPHVSVVLSNIGQDRLPGLLQQHKPKWMAEVKLHRFCLGDKPPSITCAKVGDSTHALLCTVTAPLNLTSGSIIATKGQGGMRLRGQGEHDLSFALWAIWCSQQIRLPQPVLVNVQSCCLDTGRLPAKVRLPCQGC